MEPLALRSGEDGDTHARNPQANSTGVAPVEIEVGPEPVVIPRATTPASAGDRRAAATSTRVMLVDDHQVFVEALALAIDAQPDLESVGTMGTIGACLAALPDAAPDLVLMDVYLPDGDGIDAIGEIRARSPSALILVMTGHTDVGAMARAASAGASGFLPKESSIATVLAAIRTARDGQMLVDGTTLAAILGRVSTAGVPRANGPSVLTAREQEVIELMGRGLDPNAIADQLGISVHTCRGHEKNILAKLEAHSQLEAVVIAARRGMIARLGR
jgi:DNA-binding NarL/FixJ family response regulator